MTEAKEESAPPVEVKKSSNCARVVRDIISRDISELNWICRTGMLSMLRDVRSVDFYSRPQKGRCGKTNRLALTMLTLIMICSVAQGNPKCLGIGDAASEKKCRSIEGKEACLESEVVSDKNYTATCVWHDNQKYSVIDIQKVSSRGFPLGVVGLNYRGSLCGLRMTVDLPKEAKSKWGVNTRLWGTIIYCCCSFYDWPCLQ